MLRKVELTGVSRFGTSGRHIEYVTITASRIDGDDQVYLYVGNSKRARAQHYVLPAVQLQKLLELAEPDLKPDPIEELDKVEGHEGHETRVEPEGDKFRAKCSCGWQGIHDSDSEHSAGYAAFGHRQLQRLAGQITDEGVIRNDGD